MSEQRQSNITSEAGGWTMRSYITGFLLSLGLTLTAYILVWRHASSQHTVLSDGFLNIAVAVLAVTQLFVQLIFFLHLSRESKPRWNLAAASFAALIVLILVLGSIWIMNNLNYHHNGFGVTHNGHPLNSPSQTNRYIIQDEGFQSR